MSGRISRGSGAPYARYTVGAADRVFLNKVEVRTKATDAKAVYFHELGAPDAVHQVLWTEIDALTDAGILSFEKDYYSNASAKLKVARRMAPLHDLNDIKRSDLSLKYTAVMEVRDFMKKLPLDIERRKEVAINEVWPQLRLRNLSSEFPSRIAKKERLPLSTWNDWNNALLECNDNPQALIDTRAGQSNYRIHEDVEDLLDQAVTRWLRPHGGTQPHQHRSLERAVTSLNESRAVQGLKALDAPCLKTFQRRVKDVDAFMRLALKHGIETAEKAYRENVGGLFSFRPGERIEVDGWYVHLHSLLEKEDVAHLSPDERKKLKTVRLYIVVAIDTATRMIVSVKFGWTEDETLIQGALRETIQDKSPVARALGCKNSWEIRAFGTFVADNNPAFKTADITWKTLKAMNTRQSSIAGMAWHRGRIERFFRTVATKLLTLILGQTGSNPRDRDDYQNASYAVLSRREVEEALILWIVDVYHSEKHDGTGISPRRAYYILSQIYPPYPPLAPRQISEIFGLEVRYRLGAAGLVINYTQYQSDQLQLLRQAIGDGAFVDVKIDHEDLRQVLVKIPKRLQARQEYRGEQWISVPHPKIDRRFSLRDLDDASDELAERFGYDCETSEATARAAMETLNRKVEEATARQLSRPPIGREYLEARQEKKVHEFLRWGDPDFLAAQKAEVHQPFLIPGAVEPAATDLPSSIDYSIKD
ncbi:DDE-type integrase/transposase/recombinase [Devosia sp. Leaf64]|uniref:DDE-type integrase/transposase/recombinase n=1 Tax=Devosia sp. Leaf64 TaxID=1736229 RepID=UPI000714A2FA|nr:DDE-type integrase/transposase/recombinase [Devosia sp. Leaf64]KQN77506.1 hypothetical protein ASE94_16005 [Devosia sp. Leaf64]